MKSFKKSLSKIFVLNMQNRLVLGFMIATCLTGLVATIVGIKVINKNTMNEVNRKVQQDTNTAKLIYNYNMEKLTCTIRWIALRFPLHDIISYKNPNMLEDLNRLVREETCKTCTSGNQDNSHIRMDMLSVIDASGKVLHRASNPGVNGDNILWDPVVRRCLKEKVSHVSTELMSIQMIEKENPELSLQLGTAIVKTPQSIEVKKAHLSEGMVLRVAYPIFDNEKNLLGALVGGTLLNKNYTLVDKMKKTVYHNEKYKGHDMGFATIFQGGVRISTNVMTKDNKRAIGTIVSKEVYERVIEQGKDWIGRAFVVNNWYISSYTPIHDINKNIIGMLYTGILEAKYRDMKLRTIWMFLGITILGMIIAFIISFFLGHSIIVRMRILKNATRVIATGNLDYQLPRDKFAEFGILDEAFNNMVKSLKDRDERLQKAYQQLTRTEKLAALGQTAAGVAHEINNPLGGILLYSNLVLEELPEDNLVGRENMGKIISQADRCKGIVQSLLDFARAPSGEMLSIQINDVILASLGLVREQSMFLGIQIDTRLADNLPEIKGDRSRLEQVLLNFLINAADAMNGKGKLTITTKLRSRFPLEAQDEGVQTETEKICLLASTKTVKITISDTGKGIDRASLLHIFEPFYTTKGPGKGTGLGLSIAYGIIQRHDGFIDVESEKGKGTTFSIFLPAYLETDSEAREEKDEGLSIG
jgi:two-component system NtrC family sensor kinase